MYQISLNRSLTFNLNLNRGVVKIEALYMYLLSQNTHRTLTLTTSIETHNECHICLCYTAGQNLCDNIYLNITLNLIPAYTYNIRCGQYLFGVCIN